MDSAITPSVLIARRTGLLVPPSGLKVGYDYVHSPVDDHSRLAYSEILPD